MSQMKLVSCGKKQGAHVDGKEVGAVATSNRDGLEQTSARNTYLNRNPQTYKKQSKKKNKKKVGLTKHRS